MPVKREAPESVAAVNGGGRPTKRTAASNSSCKTDSLKESREAEKAERKAARMIRNRHSAQASRDRKKAYTMQLESRVVQLEEALQQQNDNTSAAADAIRVENEELKSHNGVLSTRLQNLENENSALRQQLSVFESKFSTLEALLASSNNNNNTTTTAVAKEYEQSQKPVAVPPESSCSSSPAPLDDTHFDPSNLNTSTATNASSPISTPTTPALSPSSNTKAVGTSLVAREGYTDSRQWMTPALSYLMNLYRLELQNSSHPQHVVNKTCRRRQQRTLTTRPLCSTGHPNLLIPLPKKSRQQQRRKILSSRRHF